MARPRKLNEHLIKAWEGLMAKSNTRTAAAAIVEVSYESVAGWMGRGKDVEEYLAECEEDGGEPEPLAELDTLCGEFRRATTRGEAAGQCEALTAMRDAYMGYEEVTDETVKERTSEGGAMEVTRETKRVTIRRDWRAADRLLQARYRSAWGPTLDVNVGGELSKTVILKGEIPEDLKPDAGKAWAEEVRSREEEYADASEEEEPPPPKGA